MKGNSKWCLIYITASNIEEGRKIGQHLTKKRLAACANIVPKIESFYWWEGELCSQSETLVLAKTRCELVKKLISEVKKIHSYTLPCIVSLQISGGNPDFLKWIEEETEIREKLDRGKG